MILLHFKVYFYLFDNIYKIYLLVWIISYIFVPTTKGKIITNYQNIIKMELVSYGELNISGITKRVYIYSNNFGEMNPHNSEITYRNFAGVQIGIDKRYFNNIENFTNVN